MNRSTLIRRVVAVIALTAGLALTSGLVLTDSGLSFEHFDGTAPGNTAALNPSTTVRSLVDSTDPGDSYLT